VRRITAVLVALVVAVPVLGLAAPAQAHNYLVASTPADGETLTELPAEFSVTTNEALLSLDGSSAGFALEIRGDDGLYFGDGCVRVEDATLSETAALGEAGDYTMLWQLISADGHTVSGEIGFNWAPADDAELSAGASSPATCGNGVAAPEASSPSVPRTNADLGDVLWIGGAIVALLVAGFVTFLVATRKRR